MEDFFNYISQDKTGISIFVRFLLAIIFTIIGLICHYKAYRRKFFNTKELTSFYKETMFYYISAAILLLSIGWTIWTKL